MTNPFEKATKAQAKLRMAIDGISGSGKTFTALAIGTVLAAAAGGRLCFIDTENNSAAKYADRFDFDTLNMRAPFDPIKLVELLKIAEHNGYAAIVIDSMSPFWEGTGGVLEIVDEAAKRSRSGNTYMAWREGTPVQNELINAIVQCQMHLIACMRVKSDYVLEQDKNGKTVPKKVGMAPVQRAGFEYEFDIYGSMTAEHDLIITKSRCVEIDRKVIHLPGKELAKTLLDWLSDGVPSAAPAPAALPAPAAAGKAEVKPESAKLKLARVLLSWGQTQDKTALKPLSRKACVLAKIDPDAQMDEATATACLLAVNQAIQEEVKPEDVPETDIPGGDEPQTQSPAKTTKAKSPSVKQMTQAAHGTGKPPRKPAALPAYAEPTSLEEAQTLHGRWTHLYNSAENADQHVPGEVAYAKWALESVNAYIARHQTPQPASAAAGGGSPLGFDEYGNELPF